MDDQQVPAQQERELLEARYRTLHSMLYELATGSIRQSLPDSVLAPVYAFYYREYVSVLTRLSTLGMPSGIAAQPVPPESVHQAVPVPSREQPHVRSLLARHTIGILALSGAFLLGIATLLFVAYGTQFGRLPRLAAVLVLYLVLGGVSLWSSRRQQFRDVFLIYVLLFALMTPLVFLGLYRFVIGPAHALSPLWMLTLSALCCGMVYEALGWRLSSLWYSGFGAGACGVAWCAFAGAVLTQQWAVVLIGAGGLIPLGAILWLPASVPAVVRLPMRALFYGMECASLLLGFLKLFSLLASSTLLSAVPGLPEIPLWTIVLLAVVTGVFLAAGFQFKRHADMRASALIATLLVFVVASTVAAPYYPAFCKAQGCVNLPWLRMIGIRPNDLIAVIDVLLAGAWWALYRLRTLGEDSQSTLAIGLLLAAFLMVLTTSTPVLGLVLLVCSGSIAIGMQQDIRTPVWRIVPLLLALDAWQQLLRAFLFITDLHAGTQLWVQWYALFPFVLVGMDVVLRRAVPNWTGGALRLLVYIGAASAALVSFIVALGWGYSSTAGWTILAYGLLAFGIGKRERKRGMAVVLGSLAVVGILLIAGADLVHPFPGTAIALAAAGMVQMALGRFHLDPDTSWERWHFWVGVAVVLYACVVPLGAVDLPLRGDIAWAQLAITCIVAVVVIDASRAGGILGRSAVARTVWRMAAAALAGFSLDWLMAMGSSVTLNGAALTIIPSGVVTAWAIAVSPRQQGSGPAHVEAYRYAAACASSVLLLGTFTECWAGSAAVWYIALLLVESVVLIAAGVARTQRVPTIIGGIGAVAAACAAITELASNFPLYVVFAVVAVLLIVASTILAVVRSRMLAKGELTGERKWDRWF